MGDGLWNAGICMQQLYMYIILRKNPIIVGIRPHIISSVHISAGIFCLSLVHA